MQVRKVLKMKLHFITLLLLTVIHQNIALPNDIIATSSVSSNKWNFLAYFKEFKNYIYNYFRPNTKALRQIVSIPVIRNQIMQYLNDEDLDNMLNVSFFKEYAMAELLKRRYKIGYIRHGELFPKFFPIYHWEARSSSNKTLWPILYSYGNISHSEYLYTLLLTKNRTECLQLCRNRKERFPATSLEYKVDGFLIPRALFNRITYARFRLANNTVLIWKDERFQKFLFNYYLWSGIKCLKEPIKLMFSFFTFPSDNPLPFTHVNLESFAQTAINDTESQICIASETSAEMLGISYACNDITIFGGENVEASTFVVKTDNETKLLEQFERWNIERISNWSNYQKIAIHITATDSKEPKNGENLFNKVFDDVKLITRYLSGNATSSVLSSRDGLQRGSIYAIIGFVNKL